MSKTIYLGQECEISKLDQFIGHRVQICTDDKVTFYYNDFNWEIDCENDLVLMDESHFDCKTYITVAEIELVKNLDNNDMEHDVINIDYNGKRISICCDD